MSPALHTLEGGSPGLDQAGMRVAGSEVDDINPASDELSLLLGDSSEWVFG